MKYKLLFILLLSIIALSFNASADTLILRPDAAGFSTQCLVFPSGSNYAAVDDVTPDDDSTYVYWNVQGSNRIDLYSLQDTTANGTINSVRVYGTNWGHSTSSVTYRLFTHVTSYSVGGDGSLSQTWTEVAGTTQTTNPNTASAWTWQEINDLQVGVSLYKGGIATVDSRTTQLYVVVDYDPFIPPVPVNLTSTEGLYYVNYTWDAGIGDFTDSYNVSLNDVWTNGSTNTYFNSTSGINGWHNISIYAFNSTGNGTVGFLSSTSLDENIQLPPQLLTPTDDSTISESFPPISHDVTFTWEDTLYSYKFQLAKDENFTLIVNEQFISSNTTTLSLTEDEYHWRVANYNPITATTSNYSQIYNFTLDLTSPTIEGTAIDGVVYEKTDAGDIAVDEVIVSIYNGTWSDQQITGSNGYYQFTGLANDTYSIQATKQGYVDSNIELVTTTFNTTITKNILIERRSGAGDQYDFHYVKYTLKDIINNRYSNVNVEVFENGDVVAIFSGETGTDGSITFILNRDQEYRLEFTNTSQGIDEEITHYPKDDSYNVYIDKSLIPSDTSKESDNIDITISKSTINNTHAYINVSYIDSLTETSNLFFYLNQSDSTDPFNQTNIDSYSNALTSNITHSFIITPYSGQTFVVNINADHTTYDSIDYSFSVRFEGMAEDHGFSNIWIWLSIAGIMFMGLMFKATKSTQGALIIVGAGWIFVSMDWLDNLGDKGVTMITAGLTLASVLAIAANMSKRRKED